MARVSRRKFLESAVALGATAVWGRGFAVASTVPWKERRDLFPEGVASGDPDSHSVLLWTRRAPIDDASIDKLHVEVAEDEKFEHVVATADAPLSKDADYTCRVLVGGLNGKIKGGRHIAYPTRTIPTGNLLLTVLDKFDIQDRKSVV